ncbi:uroporphyrinogen-III synthase [Microbacterium sp. M3]|uniref:Uroporphyrinogen-III synthase n=1 Tax=Microbacterium arthrosphaerae TaxID=792652 RepID=A0ABU4H2H1_9MICO|nr:MULTISPECIES: uroporphyrinogen-III synthase [Microbacterium]MDW4572849.1 uroporphyrinogen-III synthase [Microbacterium arthrosphaerae]MDW7606704.1 uroporphyrinogen-III synthase [Microbacterium sp. M3]
MSSTTRPTLSAALDGCTIVIAVDRRSLELAAALERHGAQVRHAPALTIVPHIDDDALIAATRELIARPPDVVVATTGVGFRGWMEAADEAGLLDELQHAIAGAQIVARGPKARGAIQQAGLTADWVAESETSAELGEFLLAEGVAGRRVAVQHHGSGADGLDELFARAGADVVSLTVYRWGPPPDPAAVSRSVVCAAQGEVDAVLFTSAPGAAEWLAAARSEGMLEPIVARAAEGRLLMAAVGPITAGPLEAAGMTPLIAERGRLGSLVRAVVTHFGGGGCASLLTAAGRLELRSSGIVLEGRHIPLSRSATDIVAALFDAGGGVVSRQRLQAVLPRSGENTHAVEMAVARLREALGVPDLVKTVVKRGYRLNVVDPA